MSRTHVLPRGVHIAPMPEPIKGNGDVNRKLPGGYCPRGMRTQWTNLASQHARGSRRIEPTASPKYFEIEREFKRGVRVYDFDL